MKTTVSVLGVALLTGALALAQTSSTTPHKSSKSKRASDTNAATPSPSTASNGQSADTTLQTGSGNSGSSSSDTSASQVKAGNSGFDDTSSPAQASSTASTNSGSAASADSSSSTPASSYGQSASQSGSTGAGRISNGPVAETVGDSSALLGWATHDAASNTGVKYGTSRTNLSETAQGTEGADGKNHHARLQGLQPNTRYYFQITEGGSAVGGVGTFKTTAVGEAPVQSKAIIPQK